jgi:hypothetical protein
MRWVHGDAGAAVGPRARADRVVLGTGRRVRRTTARDREGWQRAHAAPRAGTAIGTNSTVLGHAAHALPRTVQRREHARAAVGDARRVVVACQRRLERVEDAPSRVHRRGYDAAIGHAPAAQGAVRTAVPRSADAGGAEVEGALAAGGHHVARGVQRASEVRRATTASLTPEGERHQSEPDKTSVPLHGGRRFARREPRSRLAISRHSRRAAGTACARGSVRVAAPSTDARPFQCTRPRGSAAARDRSVVRGCLAMRRTPSPPRPRSCPRSVRRRRRAGRRARRRGRLGRSRAAW